MSERKKKCKAKTATIDDVEMVEDAIIIAHLRAAKINIDYACKDFKRYHYRFKETNLADDFRVIRHWVDGTLKDLVDYCNHKVQGMREDQLVKMFNREHYRKRKGGAE